MSVVLQNIPWYMHQICCALFWYAYIISCRWFNVIIHACSSGFPCWYWSIPSITSVSVVKIPKRYKLKSVCSKIQVNNNKAWTVFIIQVIFSMYTVYPIKIFTSNPTPIKKDGICLNVGGRGWWSKVVITFSHVGRSFNLTIPPLGMSE